MTESEQGPLPRCWLDALLEVFLRAAVPAETPIFVVFGDFEWAQNKDHFPKTLF